MESEALSSRTQKYRIGIDVGGTFTDLQILDQDSGKIGEFKISSTPQDPAIGILDGIRGAAARFGFGLDEIAMIVHGTTIATNAVLEHKLSKAALITTAGFEDVLEIARHARKDIYGLYAEERRLLVERPLRFGVAERIAASGVVERPVDLAEIDAIAGKLVAQGIESLAVCLLNAYVNPAHEQAIGAHLARAWPGLRVTLSTALSPEIREYERSSTAVLNAALTPIVATYMQRLRARLAEAGIGAGVLVLQSNGGSSLPEHAAEEPARLLLSGPCGGTIAAERVSELTGEPNLIAVDMGGTSFDISLIRDGRVTRVAEGEVDGCPVRLPMAEIATIGAGGGSIAWIDDAGRLRVGPQSAGSAPGPACYGRGGNFATVTDANLVLGRMDDSRFMGGAMRLDAAAARRVVSDSVCTPLSLGLEEAAEGIVSIATSHMANAIRLALFERGLDPEDFALVSFGGAGGLHSALVAEETGVGRIIYPRGASTLSAYGMLWTDILHDFARTRIVPADAAAPALLQPLVDQMLAEGSAALTRDGIAAPARVLSLDLDLRYRGQGYELTIPMTGTELTPEAIAAAAEAFHRLHQQRFSYSDPAAAVEIVTLRITARGLLPKAGQDDYQPGEAPPPGSRRIWLRGGHADVSVFTRAAVSADGVAGPLLVEEEFTTILIPDGWRLKLLANGELLAVKEEMAE